MAADVERKEGEKERKVGSVTQKSWVNEDHCTAALRGLYDFTVCLQCQTT